jgi:hypothetical protein
MSTWLKRVLICASFAAGALAVAAGPASATEPSDEDAQVEQAQEATNTNTTDQTANATADTYQVNVNAPISILSHDANNGDVDQSNEADTNATSYNGNATVQSVDQGQTASTGDGSSCDPCEKDDGSISQDQTGSNSNDTTQEANSEATTYQVNVNAPIAVLSKNSNNGDVDQSNEADTTAYSGNSNGTTQGVTQDQGATSDGSGSGDGCGCEADGGDISQSQDGSNTNSTDQTADSSARTEQWNVNVPIAILSYGSNNGDVHQSNEADTTAWSRNENTTGQWIGQSQSAEAGGSDCGCGSGGDISQTQTGSNENRTYQDATSNATTEQKNVNVPISVLSYGSNNGDVDQSNQATTTAYSGNRNWTFQGIEQSQDATSTGGGPCCPETEPKHAWFDHPCGCDSEDGDGVTQSQDAENGNSTDQTADSYAGTYQKNWSSPISILSIGSNNGDVTQSNDATTTAWSRNENGTGQWIGQSQTADAGGSGCDPCDSGDISQTQSGSNSNTTYQDATSEARTEQKNVNVPISVLSIGGGPCRCDGASSNDVEQSNDATTTAYSGNRNATHQVIGQNQEATSTGGGPCCPETEPKHAWFEHPCGCEDGKDGDGITQTQDADNANSTRQNADATASTYQKNRNSPISVLSIAGGHPCDPCGHPCDPCGGSGGDVNQSNDADTTAWSRNENATGQWIGQSQSATSNGHPCCPTQERCGCDHGDGDISQSQTGSNSNRTEQDATSNASTTQRNVNVPFSLLSIGSGGGDVTQANRATTTAYAGNGNFTLQGIDQRQDAAEGGSA